MESTLRVLGPVRPARVDWRLTNSARGQSLDGAAFTAPGHPRLSGLSTYLPRLKPRVRLVSSTPAVAIAPHLQEVQSGGKGSAGQSAHPMSTPSRHLSLEKRLALLREIRDGRDTLRAGPSAEAQAVLAAKLAAWRELAKLEDITLRTIHEMTGVKEELQLAIAILSPSGRLFLTAHKGESAEPSDQG